MPLYDVRCTNCQYRGEVDKAFEAILPSCACGGELKQVYHAPAIVFQASGFYRTDSQFERMVGADRYGRFEAQKRSAMQRARDGQLTAYERELETI